MRGMSKAHLLGLLSGCALFVGADSRAQVPGQTVHVDFEKREPVFTYTAPVTAAYTAGPGLHVDLEKREPVFTYTAPVTAAYTAGPGLHVDFEKREPVYAPVGIR